MKKDFKKYLLIASILLSVTSLALGFAAYQRTLTIKSSAIVSPTSDSFSVKLSSSDNSVVDGTLSAIDVNGDGIKASDATIVNGINPTITGIKVDFTSPGQSAIYKINVHNTGEYNAYFNSIVFNNLSGKDSNIVCTAISGTTQSSVDNACKGIYIAVNYQAWMFYSNKVDIEYIEPEYRLLEPGESQTLYFYVIYDEAASEADGPFEVSFGDVSIIYSSNAPSE